MSRSSSGSKRASVLVLACVLVAVLAVVAAGCGGSGSAKERVTVTGSGIGKTVPDEVRVTVAVVTDGKTVSEATTPNNQKAQAVIDALKGIGLGEKAIKTEAVDIQPKYSEPGTKGGTRNIVGYTATNRIRVTTKQVDKLGQVIETAVAAGANTVDTLEMVATARQKAEADGLALAVKDARVKAEAAAKAAGRELGDVVTVSELGVEQPSPESYMAPPPSMAMTVRVPVSPGQNEYTVSAKVVFELR